MQPSLRRAWRANFARIGDDVELEDSAVRSGPSSSIVKIGSGSDGLRGLDANSEWTALLLGFLLAGAGAGLVNPTLAEAAIGVVPPSRAGVATGINNTFRQIGIAVGIAVLGAVFQGRVETKLEDTLVDTYEVRPGSHT